MPSYRSVSEFDDEELALERKRKIIAAIMAQEAPAKTPQGRFYTPDYGAAQKGLQDAIGMYGLTDLDRQSKDLASKRADFARQALQEYPTAKPAVPEVVGTGPLAPPPGTPGVDDAPPPAPAGEADVMPMPSANNMTPDSPALWAGKDTMDMVPRGLTGNDFTPNKAGEAAMIPGIQDYAKWGIKYAGLSPFHASLATEGYKRALDQPEKARLATEAIAAKADLAQQNRIQRTHELNLKLISAETQKEKDSINKLLLEEYRGANAYERKELDGIIREGLKTMGDAGTKGTIVIDGTTKEGDTIFRNTKDENAAQFTIKDGVRVPHTGQTYKPGEEKAIGKAMEGQAQVDYTDNLVKRVLDPANKNAFSPSANIGAALASKTEGFVSPKVFNKKLSEEQMVLRTEVYRNFAELIHQMYGSAYTSGEQARGGTYTVMQGDNDKEIARKLKGQASFLREMEQKYGNKVRAAAEARNPKKTVNVEY